MDRIIMVISSSMTHTNDYGGYTRKFGRQKNYGLLGSRGGFSSDFFGIPKTFHPDPRDFGIFEKKFRDRAFKNPGDFGIGIPIKPISNPPLLGRIPYKLGCL